MLKIFSRQPVHGVAEAEPNFTNSSRRPSPEFALSGGRARKKTPSV